MLEHVRQVVAVEQVLHTGMHARQELVERYWPEAQAVQTVKEVQVVHGDGQLLQVLFARY